MCTAFCLSELSSMTVLFRLQVSEFRQKTTFTGNYYTVNYTTYSFQTFLANESCAGCQLTDVLVTVNR